MCYYYFVNFYLFFNFLIRKQHVLCWQLLSSYLKVIHGGIGPASVTRRLSLLMACFFVKIVFAIWQPQFLGTSCRLGLWIILSRQHLLFLIRKHRLSWTDHVLHLSTMWSRFVWYNKLRYQKMDSIYCFVLNFNLYYYFRILLIILFLRKFWLWLIRHSYSRLKWIIVLIPSLNHLIGLRKYVLMKMW